VDRLVRVDGVGVVVVVVVGTVVVVVLVVVVSTHTCIQQICMTTK